MTEKNIKISELKDKVKKMEKDIDKIFQNFQLETEMRVVSLKVEGGVFATSKILVDVTF